MAFRTRPNCKVSWTAKISGSWFTLIAEGQFYHLSEQWNTEQRDCAGLVRFAWREALRRHDRAWFQKMGPGYQAVAPDVGRYTLEQGPLGEKLFRTSFGSYKDGDLSSGAFSDFADARTLKNFNVKFISRDRHYAQPGDLLVLLSTLGAKVSLPRNDFSGRLKARQ